MDVHHQVTDRASRTELDLGVTPANERETVDTVDDDFVSATRYALDGDRVTTESREKAIVPLGFGVATAGERKPNERETKPQRCSAVLNAE